VIEYKSGRSAGSPLSVNQVKIYGVLVKELLDEVRVEVRDFRERIYFKGRIEETDRRWLRDWVKEYRRAVAEGVFPARRDKLCDVCPLRKKCEVLNTMGRNIWGW